MTLSSNPAERPRRFYKSVDTVSREDGHAVTLDGRTPKTPGGKPLVAPTQALARLLADEWDAQTGVIALDHMHATRLANTAIDLIGGKRVETAAEVARYAGSDVLCYFADHPDSLVARQNERWGPVLDWAEQALGVKLERTVGILHRAQPVEVLERVEALARSGDDFALAGLAFAAPLYGSAVLALAVRHGRLTGEAAFDLSRLDEVFQEERWGVDVDAAARIAALRLEAIMIGDWFAALT